MLMLYYIYDIKTMHKKLRNKHPSTHLFILTFLMVSAIFSGLTLVYIKSHSDTVISQEVSQDGPTEKEAQAGDNKKEAIDETSIDNVNVGPDKNIKTTGQENSVSSAAEVIIVDAAQYGSEVEVRSFIANIIQRGECKLIMKNEALVIERTVPATADATTTQCGSFMLKVSDFKKLGIWGVEVIYTSASDDITGKASTTLEVE
jgi:hypothetical protein